MALLTCKDVSLAYENNIVASELDFTVNSGEYLCVVGENGSGKSTLIKGILGLVAPHSGEIILGDGLKRTEIGYLPQQTGAQRDFPASVFEVVQSGCLNSRGLRPFYSKADKARALDNMELLGISDIRKSCYRELSGGQQQRVLLARALCAAKKLILLDEPVAGLDPLVTREMYDIISMLNRERGITIIMVSHDIAASLEYASHILHLHKTPLFFGTASDYALSAPGRKFLGGERND